MSIETLYRNGMYNWQAISRQGEVWIDARGKVHRIAEMDAGYRANALAFLIRHHGEQLLQAEIKEYICGAQPVGDGAWDAFNDEFGRLLEMDAHEYVQICTPLGRALAS